MKRILALSLMLGMITAVAGSGCAWLDDDDDMYDDDYYSEQTYQTDRMESEYHYEYDDTAMK